MRSQEQFGMKPKNHHFRAKEYGSHEVCHEVYYEVHLFDDALSLQ